MSAYYFLSAFFCVRFHEFHQAFSADWDVTENRQKGRSSAFYCQPYQPEKNLSLYIYIIRSFRFLNTRVCDLKIIKQIKTLKITADSFSIVKI